MDIIIFILLILLLNTILGCLAACVSLEKVTLFDLITSILSGIFMFIFIMLPLFFDWIEDKTSHIVLFKKGK